MSPDLDGVVTALQALGAVLSDLEPADVRQNGDGPDSHTVHVGGAFGYFAIYLPRDRAIALSHDLNQVIDASAALLAP